MKKLLLSMALLLSAGLYGAACPELETATETHPNSLLTPKEAERLRYLNRQLRETETPIAAIPASDRLERRTLIAVRSGKLTRQEAKDFATLWDKSKFEGIPISPADQIKLTTLLDKFQGRIR